MLSDAAYRLVEVMDGMDLPVQSTGLAIAARVQNGHTILAAGNGGSAAQAQHFAAELTGRYLLDRRALPAMALNADTAALTAIGNDYGFAQVFARQVEAFAQPGNVLVLFTTSGNSENLIEAAKVAQANEMLVVGITGRDGGKLARECSLELRVRSHDTPLIQTAHLMIAHEICKIVEEACRN